MKWISIKTGFPKDSTGCLVFFENKKITEEWVETAFFIDEYFYGTIGDTKYITHWMPLPQHP